MRPVFALFAGVACVLAANGLLGTVIGLRLSVTGHPLWLCGAVVVAFAGGLAVGSWKADALIERAGHIRAFAAFCGLSTLMTLLMSLWHPPALWLLLRGFTGFCIAGVYMVVESWLTEQTPPDRRGVVLAVYITTCQLALGAGQLLVRCYPVTGSEPFVLGAAFYGAALVPVVLTRTPQPSPPNPTRIGILAVLRTAPVAAAGSVVAGVTTGSLLSLAPLFAVGSGFERDATSTFMAAVVVGGLLLQWPVGRLADRIDRRIVVKGVAMATAMAAAGVLAASHAGFVATVAAGAGVGAFAFVLYPVSLAHVQDLVRPDDVVSASGTMVLTYGFGATAGPLLGAVAMEAWGARALPVWLMLFNTALALVGAARLVIRRRLPVAEQVPFAPVALPQTAPAVELDPRGQEQ